jgi:hypothetical protein
MGEPHQFASIDLVAGVDPDHEDGVEPTRA